MSSTKWLWMFVCILLLIALLIAGLNVLVDPFGAFGDPVMDWASANETNNPRVAKIAYLDKHHDEYDSYVIGSSSASSYPPEQLNAYTGARFYNLFMYGCDMYDIVQTARYVAEHYEVKNLLINFGPGEGAAYQYESDPYINNLHAAVDRSSPLKFYLKYAFANPNYAFAKLQNRRKDTELPQVFDVFDAETGSYDKRVRDVEPISDLASYRASNKSFDNFTSKHQELARIDLCIEAVKELKAECDARGIRLIVSFEPLYEPRLANWNVKELGAFLTRMADVTDFWCFSFNSVAADPRYYYDSSHFRNAVGEMILARMFQDDRKYVPDDFGQYVTRETVSQLVSQIAVRHPVDPGVRVPILLYHNITDKQSDASNMTSEAFEAHIQALSDAGYTAVSLDQLRAYVERGEPLPARPVVITFDDGYTSNFTLAYPILKKYNMKATIFSIGISAGRDTYRNSDQPIHPHFSYEQAREMIASGLISVQSHSYDLHAFADYEPGEMRHGVLPLPGESEHDYMTVLREDFTRSIVDLEAGTGTPVTAFAYPNGLSTHESDVVLAECGISVTLLTEPRTNTLIRGLPQCLRGMGRYNMSAEITPDKLLALLEQ